MILSSRRCRQLLALVLGARFAKTQPRSQSTSRSAPFVWAVLLALSCGGGADDASVAPPSPEARLGKVTQAITDTDGDGMDDAWETLHFGGLSQVASGDFDSDGMTNGEEHQYGLDPTVDDAYADADFDRYPNVFEIRRGSDPTSASSTPTANYTVNGAGGGTHTTISAAMYAANVSNGGYQIIAIAPGTYKGSANLRDVWVTSDKPKLLFIGLEGASKTIVDGELANYGWYFQQSAVVASLTFQRATIAHLVSAPGKQLRFVDLVVRDNIGSSWGAGIHVSSAGSIHVVGCTFTNNTGASYAQQIWIGSGSATITNTALWSTTSGTQLAKDTYATLTTSYSYVKGQTLSGTGNLAGSIDPKLRADQHLLWDSPLRGAGGAVAQSRIDADGETRPSTSPDIGADQFVDSDADDLADSWEANAAGNLTTLTSRSQDFDADGLDNEQEYAARTDPTNADTDGDGLEDGAEVSTHGTSPLLTDTDGDDMPDAWEVSHGLPATIASAFFDSDGDRYPDVFEYARSSDPSDPNSIPTPNLVVNGAGGGTHTTIGAALSAATVSNGAYQIIAIAPGTYTGWSNLRGVWVTSDKPKLLFIGLEGAAKTIIDGELTNYGWYLQQSAVVASLTFKRAISAHYVSAPSKEIRFVDLMVRDNIGSSWGAGVHVNAAGKVSVVGSTFLDNKGATWGQQIWIGAGEATMVNTVVWSAGTGTQVAKDYYATLNATYSLVKGQTLVGTGNLAGTVSPKLRSDGRLRSDSPLRGAGGAVAQSRIDADGDPRPSVSPDIGVDQYYDGDADGLPDAWEVATAGSTSAISGSGDDDGDQLNNVGEYDLETSWLDPDTDKDRILDGVELLVGTNPLVADSDDPATDINGDRIIDAVGVQLGHQPNASDSDGDGVSNADEVLMCTSTVRADTDGDGVTDDLDAFPHDPLMSTMPSNPSDVTPPIITLTSPWYAIEL